LEQKKFRLKEPDNLVEQANHAKKIWREDPNGIEEFEYFDASTKYKIKDALKRESSGSK
jgi:hypothetical protein